MEHYIIAISQDDYSLLSALIAVKKAELQKEGIAIDHFDRCSKSIHRHLTLDECISLSTL